MNERMPSYWGLPDMLEEELSADGGPLSIEIVHETGRLASLADEWDDLISRSSATAFQTFEWQYTWWKHFGSRREHHLFVVLFRAQQKLVGVAPFFLQTYSFLQFTIYRRLLLLGSGLQFSPSPLLSLVRQGVSDYLDIIVARDFEDRVSKALVALLCNESYLWDEIELQNAPGKGILCTGVIPLLEPQGYTVTTVEEDVCPFITLPKSLDEYYASLRHSVRRNLRYAHRGYIESREYQIDDFVARNNTEGGTQILERLHQKRWNSIGYPGLFADPRFGPFLNEVAELLARKGRLWFKSVRHGGKAIAANFILRLHNRLYTYISGFDRETGVGPSNSGAGSALILLALEDAINNGITEVDMGRGTESYKLQFTSVARKNWRISVTSGRMPKSALRLFIFSIRSSWVQVASRVACESFIFRTLARQNSWPRTIHSYIAHVWYRLTRKEGTTFTQDQPSTHSPDEKNHNEAPREPERPADPSQNPKPVQRRDSVKDMR